MSENYYVDNGVIHDEDKDNIIDIEFITMQIENLEAELVFFAKRTEHNKKLLAVLKKSLELNVESENE